MTFTEEIKAKYASKITVEDVISEIKKHVSETYEVLKNNGFTSNWVGFDVHTNSGVPTLVWEIDKDGTHHLLVPTSCGVDLQDIYQWFNNQGFVYCVNNVISNIMAYRIQF